MGRSVVGRVAAAVVLVVGLVGAVAVARHEPAVGAAPSAASRYVPVFPTRILDTREGIGAPLGPVPDDGVIDVQVTGEAGVPADAVAVALNVTATNATAPGYVTVWPAGDPFPLASNLNVEADGQTIANLAVVRIGAGGKISMAAYRQLDLVADVAGYWVLAQTATAGRYVGAGPARILDTRDGTGAPAAKVPGGSTIDLQVTGRGGVPSTGVSAVILNLTATNAEGPGYVTAWPSSQPQPLASNVNIESAGQTIPNLVMVPVGADGQVSLSAFSTMDLLADVLGYFTDATGAASDDGLFVPAIAPVRVLDTREELQNGGLYRYVPEDRRSDLEVNVAGTLPSPEAAAILANVTATNASGPGYVTLWPAATPRPYASNLNVDREGQTIPNLAVVGLGFLGRISMYAYAATDLVVDYAGYFTGDPTPPAPGTPLDPPPSVPSTPPPTIAPPPTTGGGPSTSGSAPTTRVPQTSTSTTSPRPPNPGDTVNCTDFATWPDANAYYQAYFPYYGDVAGLDSDGDGIVCESLPGAP